MMNATRIRRRLILGRLAGGSAVLCTFLAKLDPQTARAARPNRGTPLIIIDPGHGGRDPGATGISGTLEKDVTLASARVLRTTLQRTGRYRVELTRTEDRYIGREERVEIARELGAGLFLSMHADRLSDPSVRGASVYTLAKRASDVETAALADRENGLLPGETSRERRVAREVSGILASLAARENREASTRIAHQLVRDLGFSLPVLPSPERQANFIVLHAAHIPSVLIEMGFLSNPADEAALKEPAHRELIASAVTRAVDVWFSTTGDREPV
jgi:N-acetylmuramoyl-L-alanine amidase